MTDPPRPFREPGRGSALALGLTLACGGLVGCQASPPDSDSGLRAELGLPSHASIHRIELTVIGDRVRMLPLRTRVRQGDVVQFVVLDHRSHLIRFEEDGMDPESLAYLRRTGQDRPPPLVQRDARLLVSFADAPPGPYPFRVESSGFTTRGELLVDLP